MVTALQALNGTWPGVTVNVGVIEGGTRPNVVPGECSLEIDLRSTNREALEAAEAAVREIARPAIYDDITTDVEITGRHWPMEKLERSGRLVGHAVALAAALGFELHDAATGGASDANTTAGMGVPTIDGLGPIGGYDHSPDEYLEDGLDRAADGAPRRAHRGDRAGPRGPGVAAGARGDRGGVRGLGVSRRTRLERRPVGGERGLRAGGRGGRRCLVSGTTDAGPDGDSLHPGDAAAQARAAFAIVEGALAEAGFSLDEVVRTRMYIVDPADADAVAGVHGEIFKHVRPAATLVVVAGLMHRRACWSRWRRRPARADSRRARRRPADPATRSSATSTTPRAGRGTGSGATRRSPCTRGRPGSRGR